MHSGPRKTKIKLIEEEIEKTKKIMENNIDKLLERGEKLNALQDKSQELKLQAQLFNQQALALKRAESFKNFTWSMVLFGAVVGAGFGLYGLATGYHLAVVPIAMAIGSGLAYALTWPISAIFKHYQKLSLATAETLKQPITSLVPKKHKILLEEIKGFQPHYLMQEFSAVRSKEPPPKAAIRLPKLLRNDVRVL
ncbi:synaptobrevin family protein [Candidatus Berkiella aquae]|uniref:Synaptobrevin n=1 Tax=Candidatus Berkiella aquae TaxID=295108 RepID=A0A0Q9YU44_9GAMM|nr:synaptobrevin family protein [Candidatus Berkiella aquae]MCS5710076.1 hypothetical protein [Candidatus Berkiella aquae]